MPHLDNAFSVVVTGAGGGIGSRISADLAAAGHCILAVDRDRSSLASLDEAARRGKWSISTHVADARDESALAEALESAQTWDHPLLGAVLCAGYTLRRPILETSHEDISDLSSTNFEGTALSLKAVAHALISGGRGGSIVAITSINALRPLAEQPIYSATKAAIESLVASASIEFGPLGIRVNAIAPGAIITPMNPGLNEEHDVRLSIPLRRVGLPHDLIGPVRFLLGPESSYVTGATLTVDGGLVHMR